MKFRDTSKQVDPLKESAIRESTTDPLDALADAIRVFSRYSFELPDESQPEFTEACKRWVEHLLLGRSPDGADNSEPLEGPIRRQWKELRDFIGQRRQHEQAYVNRLIRASAAALSDVHSDLRRERAQSALYTAQVSHELKTLQQILDETADSAVQVQVLESVKRLSESLQAHEEISSNCQAKTMQSLDSFRELVRDMAGQGDTDPLTRLYTPYAFQTHFEFVSSVVSDTKEPVVVASIDVLQLHTVNHTYGHDAGDRALRAVADCIVRSFPRKNDYVARGAGSEFSVLLRDVDTSTAHRLMSRLIKNARKIRLKERQGAVDVRLAVGYTRLVAGERLTASYERAHLALKKSKHLNGTEACFIPSAES